MLISLISLFYEIDKGYICFQYPSNAVFFQNKELEPEITELKEKLKKTDTFFSLVLHG